MYLGAQGVLSIRLIVSAVPSQLELLRQALHGASVRHRVLSQNLANVNTPGYRAQLVSFEERLAELVERDKTDFGELIAEVREASGMPARQDGNNVDIDYEVTQLNKNAVLHQALTQIMATKISMIRSAITGQ